MYFVLEYQDIKKLLEKRIKNKKVDSLAIPDAINATYKAAPGWSDKANIIVDTSFIMMHSEISRYISSIVSILMGEDSYLNYYQNAGIKANQAVDAFDLTSQNPFDFKGKCSEKTAHFRINLNRSCSMQLNSEKLDAFGRPIGEAAHLNL